MSLCFAIPESFAFGRVYQVTVFRTIKESIYVSVVFEAKILPVSWIMGCIKRLI